MGIIKKFLDYVEIKTKITSIFPFLMTIGWLFSSGMGIDYYRSAVFFAGMLSFDMTATTVNNYFDSKKNGQPLPFPRRTAKAITVLLFLMSVLFGLWLFVLTDLVVLAAGALCFAFGIVYSYGPLPVSHGPFGEAVSGFFYGFVIPGILAYINLPPDRLLYWALTGGDLIVRINIAGTAALVLLAVVPFCLTANIMLANNICDLERDIEVGRRTLPFYLKGYALPLFALLYYLGYLSVIIMVIFGFLTPWSLLVMLTLVPVWKNIRLFHKKHVKEETFILSIKNFLLVIIAHILAIFAGGLLHRL